MLYAPFKLFAVGVSRRTARTNRPLRYFEASDCAFTKIVGYVSNGLGVGEIMIGDVEAVEIKGTLLSQ